MIKKVTFPSKDDIPLSGILHEPIGQDTKCYAILAHCFTCTKSLKAGVVLAKTFADNGIAALRFDFTGLGASEGQFSKSSFSSNVDDILSAAKFLKENYGEAQLLVGHSLGGTASLAAASKIDSVKAVATIGSPAAPDHILHLLENKLAEIAAKDEVSINLAGRNFVFKQSFVDDVQNYKFDISSIGKALMVMHAPLDNTVSVEQASKIFGAARHPKSFSSLDNSDHLLSKKSDAQYAANVISSWAMRFIDSHSHGEPAEEANGVTASGDTEDSFLTTMRAGKHIFLADEPASYGGSNRGPTPYDYLGAALGACTSMTLNMYARRKELDVTNVTVSVTHDRIHATDCDECTKSEGKVDQFTRAISIDGNLTEAQHTRMLEIADRCPVHKTLENEIHIVTRKAG